MTASPLTRIARDLPGEAALSSTSKGGRGEACVLEGGRRHASRRSGHAALNRETYTGHSASYRALSAPGMNTISTSRALYARLPAEDCVCSCLTRETAPPSGQMCSLCGMTQGRTTMWCFSRIHIVLVAVQATSHVDGE